MNIQNNTYQEIWYKIKKHDKITICSHINSDGDTIASSLALKELIELNLKAQVKISGEKYPRFLNFLTPPDQVNNTHWNESLKIVVDTSNKSRVFDKRIITEEAIKLDHHHHQEKWLLQVGGDNWPSCGEVIWELIEDQKLKYNQTIKDLIFIAIWTDTGGLKHRNISQQTHSVINWCNQNQQKLLQQMELNEDEKAIFKDAIIKQEGIVSYVLTDQNISNDIYREYVNYIASHTQTEVLIVLVKYRGYWRVGLRSKNNVDVSSYASKRNGGGHFASAGFETKNKTFIEIKQDIQKLIKEINNDNKSRTN